jgi:UDP-2,3-diacylglucosamine hydrolase
LDKPTKIYFLSDAHLGVPDYEKSLVREKLLVKWLDEVSKDATEIYLMGDLFDYWFEYKTVVPKGYVRVLGKLAELTDRGLPISVFTGNHDMWIFDYLPQEIGVKIFREPIVKVFNHKKFYLAHGDGLGPGDMGYKFLKKIFSNKICQWLLARLHPNFGVSLGNYWSKKSRASTGNTDKNYLGDNKEWLAIYAKEILQKEHFDYFIFGHRHLPINIKVGENSSYINLGDWLNYFTYAVFDGEKLELKYYLGK